MIALRRATVDDVDWLLALYTSDEVEPFLGGRSARDRDALLAEVERSEREPDVFGRMVIELDGERAGAFQYGEVNAPSRIVHLGGLAVHPDFRGRRLADDAARLAQRYLVVDLGYHRIELACFGFNERAIAHAERAGFVREGVKRKAYLRHGEWQDAVQFSLLAEELVDGD
ncbi:MAG TPA: GNAT family protein [Gaiellaceae bacterium]